MGIEMTKRYKEIYIEKVNVINIPIIKIIINDSLRRYGVKLKL